MEDVRMLKPGEEIRLYCDECSMEFDVVYEPKAKDDPEGAKGMPSAEVTRCPACGREASEV